MCTTKQDHAEIVQILLEAGANTVYKKHNDGEYVSLLTCTENTAIQKLIIYYGYENKRQFQVANTGGPIEGCNIFQTASNNADINQYIVIMGRMFQTLTVAEDKLTEITNMLKEKINTTKDKMRFPFLLNLLNLPFPQGLVCGNTGLFIAILNFQKAIVIQEITHPGTAKNLYLNVVLLLRWMKNSNNALGLSFATPFFMNTRGESDAITKLIEAYQIANTSQQMVTTQADNIGQGAKFRRLGC